MKIHEMGVGALAEAIQQRQLSAVQAAQAFVSRIQAVEGSPSVFLFFDEAMLLSQAKKADQFLSKTNGNDAVGLLAGVPVGLQDNICTKAMPTTCASRMLAGFVPPEDATVVNTLHNAGAVIAGKLNMNEFGVGAHKAVAAAVATGLLPCALGADTGGSLLQAAAFCGVVALRPTYGTVSRNGLVAFASSMEQIGPLARTVEDVALLFSALTGSDEGRAVTGEPFPGFTENINKGNNAQKPMGFLDPGCLNGLKIGVPAPGELPAPSPEVTKSMEATIHWLQSAGATVVELPLPYARYAPAAYTILVSAEASSNLARYDGLKYGFSSAKAEEWEEQIVRARTDGFGPQVKRHILWGTFALCGENYNTLYRHSQAIRQGIKRSFTLAFKQCDAIFMPTTVTAGIPAAYKEGERSPLFSVADAYAVLACLAGLPALSVPCGVMPQGMQLIGPAFQEQKLLSIAKVCEEAMGGFAQPEVCHAL